MCPAEETGHFILDFLSTLAPKQRHRILKVRANVDKIKSAPEENGTPNIKQLLERRDQNSSSHDTTVRKTFLELVTSKIENWKICLGKKIFKSSWGEPLETNTFLFLLWKTSPATEDFTQNFPSVSKRVIRKILLSHFSMATSVELQPF